MVDGVHGVLIRHAPKLVEPEHRKERGNVTTLVLQTVVAIALVMLKMPVNVIRGHAEVNITTKFDFWHSFDELMQHYVKQTNRLFQIFHKVHVNQTNFVVTTADVLEIAGDAMIMMIVRITAMNNIAV